MDALFSHFAGKKTWLMYVGSYRCFEKGMCHVNGADDVSLFINTPKKNDSILLQSF